MVWAECPLCGKKVRVRGDLIELYERTYPVVLGRMFPCRQHHQVFFKMVEEIARFKHETYKKIYSEVAKKYYNATFNDVLNDMREVIKRMKPGEKTAFIVELYGRIVYGVVSKDKASSVRLVEGTQMPVSAIHSRGGNIDTFIRKIVMNEYDYYYLQGLLFTKKEFARLKERLRELLVHARAMPSVPDIVADMLGGKIPAKNVFSPNVVATIMFRDELRKRIEEFEKATGINLLSKPLAIDVRKEYEIIRRLREAGDKKYMHLVASE